MHEAVLATDCKRHSASPTIPVFSDTRATCQLLDVSVVVPVFNEKDSLQQLSLELTAALARSVHSWEIIWVDDGSTDGSGEYLHTLGRFDAHFRVLHLKETQGQSAATWCGLKASNGRVIVTIDGDLQNDPRDIPRLLSALEASDFVVGERVARQDSRVKKMVSKFANGFRRLLLHDGVPDTGCSLKAIRREIVTEFVAFQGMHRFLPALALQAGFRVTSIPVNHRKRLYGTSKYGLLNRLWWPFADCLAVWWMGRRLIRNVKYSEHHDVETTF